MVKSEILANYDTMLAMTEANISYAVDENYVDGMVRRVLYFENTIDLETAKNILKEKNL